MRSAFFEYHRPSESEFKTLWRNCVFSFDANVLLDIYRYSENSRDDLLRLIAKYKERIWITHQAALEFHRNRYEVIDEARKRAADLVKRLNATIGVINTEFRQHPYVSETLCKEIVEHTKRDAAALLSAGNGYPDLLVSDTIGTKLVDELEGRVGQSFNDKEMADLSEKIEERYKNRIPPGYEDAKKPPPDSYGDCIIWFELMQFAKSEKKSIIYVTRDQKEDWWVLREGRTLIPRPELRREFKETTGQDIYLYQAPQFIQYAKELVDENISLGLVTEAQVISTSTTSTGQTSRDTESKTAEKRDIPPTIMGSLRSVVTTSESVVKQMREKIALVDQQIAELVEASKSGPNDQLDEQISDLTKQRAAFSVTLRGQEAMLSAFQKYFGSTGNSGSEETTRG